ncbi:TIGR02270 family protein [Paraburkholderia panacisoli]|uniref:TIGR02270 family protein n=1 Tax=Paraburkholderia panacisoli TaxID=2603818 RepID=A0A5B0HGX5_9BURK|nr:TIGR02270 family protein [Paraburkholderia panacisoli]KAA1014525.1 TIGR02270 family protein [Paraburkholderia panacisoli]
MSEVIDDLVSRYAEDAAFLWLLRRRAADAPDYALADLAEVDERVAAHLEALQVSGAAAWHHCAEELANGTHGAAFVAAVLALDACDAPRLETVLVAVEEAPDKVGSVVSAFGWVDPCCLRSVVADMLTSRSAVRQEIALAACAMHGRDPGLASGWLAAGSPAVRARALRVAGQLGKTGCLADARAALAHPGLASAADPECRFWAAWSAVLLGARGVEVDALFDAALVLESRRSRGLTLALQAMGPKHGTEALKRLPADTRHKRTLVEASGLIGLPDNVPWMIAHMRDARFARVAGEAFSLVTGVDLVQSKLQGACPADFSSGPNDDPSDDDVAMDRDDGLPWPHEERIERWWHDNGGRFRRGTRYFMGAPVAREQCLAVLGEGTQRQRALAANYLCLLAPGTPLFDTRACARLQQKALAARR